MRRWSVRIGLALVVAIAIGYVPGAALGRDRRAVKLEQQLHRLKEEAQSLAASNAQLSRQIEALRGDVKSIEDHARADLGMVYPDEVIFRVRDEGAR